MKQYSDVVLDRNGNVVVGATVTVKDSPSGTTSTVYASNDPASGNVNPLTTDQNGRFSFYAKDGAYTVSVAKTGIVTTSSPAFTLKDDTGELIDVKGYGAVGDGVANDTSAIQAALTAGSIYLPPGTYKINAALTVPDGQVRHIVGAGVQTSFILQTNATANGITVAHTSLTAGGSVRDLSIAAGSLAATNQQSSGVGLSLSNVNGDYQVDCIDIRCFATAQKVVDSWYTRTTNFQFVYCTTAGIQVGPNTPGVGGGNYWNGGKLSNNGFTGTNAGSAGILVKYSGGEYFAFIDSTSFNENIAVRPDAGAFVLFLFFDNVLADTADNDNWIFDASAAGSVIDSVVCSGCWASYATGGNGIHLKGSVSAWNWNGGRSRENGQHGFYIENASDWAINDTQIARNSKLTTLVYSGVNVVAGVSTGAIIGCRIGNFDSGLSHEQLNGITLAGATANVRIIGNDLSVPGTGGVGLSNTSSGPNVIKANLPVQLGYDQASGAYFSGCCTAAVAAASTVYLGPSGAQPNEANAVWVAPRAGRVTFAYAATDVAPGVGKNFTYTVRKNFADSSMTFQQSGNASFTNETSSNSFTVAKGDSVCIKLVTDAGAGTPNVRYSLILDN